MANLTEERLKEMEDEMDRLVFCQRSIKCINIIILYTVYIIINITYIYVINLTFV